MAYIGNQADTAFTSLIKQDLTGASGTSLTLTHAVANANDIALYINNVRQEPVSAYSTNGTAVSLTGSVVSSDDIYVIYLARAVQTTVPPDGSVSTAKLADDAVTNAKINNSTIDLTSKVTGVLPVANGGIGATSYVSVYAQGTSGYVTGSTGDFLPLTAVYQHKGTGNADYNTSTYKYTAPVNGIYQINLCLIVQATNVSTHYELNVDGTNVFVFAWSSGGRDSDGSTSIYLDAGQVVGFRNGNNAGYYRHSASMPTNDHYTVASFCLLREL